MRLDFREIPDPINNPTLYNAQLPPPLNKNHFALWVSCLLGCFFRLDFQDETCSQEPHKNYLTFHQSCNIAREQALLLMLDSSQAKKSRGRACSQATCNTTHKLLGPKLACPQTFFLARKRRREPISTATLS